MKSRLNAIILLALATALSACASNRPQGPATELINRALVSAPGAAQPSDIVATELAYARTAKEQGLYTAGQLYAAQGAVFHTRNGPQPALPLFSNLRDPETATQWAPRAVVMSCDGALALSIGRFIDAEGFVGNYVTTWVRQGDNSYRWSYDVAGRDHPQPPPRAEIEDGDIVVTAIDAVQGLVASCPRGGETTPAPPALETSSTSNSATQISRDGTLRWRWEHRTDGTKYVRADYFFQGQWVKAIEESLASPTEE